MDQLRSSEESVFAKDDGSGSEDSVKPGSVASLVAKLEQSPTTPVGNTSTPVSGRSLALAKS
jgi:hypothetical protein